MNCCQCNGIEEMFDSKVVKRDLKRYRKKGPRKETRILIDALKGEKVNGMTLLDIGGGVGIVQNELLKAGVIHVTDIDASSSYLEAAKEETQRQGYLERVKYYYGDFVNLAPNIESADIVTLDKVICCYDNMERLIRLSSTRAKKLYGVIYPRDTWWVKLGIRTGNLMLWFSRSQFRIFSHPMDLIDQLIRDSGLKQSFSSQTLFWQVAIYSK